LVLGLLVTLAERFEVWLSLVSATPRVWMLDLRRLAKLYASG
jgi:hypothetical protein